MRCFLATLLAVAALALTSCQSMRAPALDSFDVLLAVPVPVVNSRPTQAASVVAPLLAYYGCESNDDVASRGTLTASELLELLHKHGLEAQAFHASLDDVGVPTSVLYQLKQGRPLLVLLQTGDDELSWKLLVGFSRAPALLAFQSPGGKLHTLAWEAFAHAWEASGNVCVLAMRSQEANAAFAPRRKAPREAHKPLPTSPL